MITFNSERGLVVVDNWGDIEGRPGFVKDLDPSKHGLKAIIGRYVFRRRGRAKVSPRQLWGRGEEGLPK